MYAIAYSELSNSKISCSYNVANFKCLFQFQVFLGCLLLLVTPAICLPADRRALAHFGLTAKSRTPTNERQTSTSPTRRRPSYAPPEQVTDDTANSEDDDTFASEDDQPGYSYAAPAIPTRKNFQSSYPRATPYQASTNQRPEVQQNPRDKNLVHKVCMCILVFLKIYHK